MACSKFEKIEKLQKKLEEMTSDPAVANELINREMGQIDKNTALNIAREEGEAKGRLEGEAKGRLEGEAKGRLEGEAKGRLEGEAKEKKEIAKRMLLANIPIQQISAITGLSESEIEDIEL